MKGLYLLIFGTVQGVFFRKSTQEQAVHLRLCGWVRNRTDGTVEVYAEGQEKDLIQLMHWCGKGPPMSKVGKVDIAWVETVKNLTSFEIRQTI